MRFAAALFGLLATSWCTAQATLLDLALMSSDGQPLARQDVALVAGDATGAGFPATALQKALLGRTDEDGHCVFAVPRFDLYWLRIGGVEAVLDAWPVLPAATRQQVQIAAPGAIEVVDALADERPPTSELRVMVRSLSPDGEAVERRGRGDRLAFSRLRPGRYVIAMVVDGHRYAQHTVTVAPGQTLQCKLYPADGLAAKGRVTDAGGAPLAGARLFGSCNSLLDVTTDTEGRFDLGRCGGMAMHKVMLQTADGELQQIALANLLEGAMAESGEVHPLELVLAPLAKLPLRVQRRDGDPLTGIRAQQVHLGRRLALQAESASDRAWSLSIRGAAPAPERLTKVREQEASSLQVLVLADGCALAGYLEVVDSLLELDVGVTRVFRMTPEAAGPPVEGGRWLTVSQSGKPVRRVPICSDGRALVSHLAVGDCSCEGDGGRDLGWQVDAQPFAELDLR